MTQKIDSFEKKYANFYSELNMNYSDYLINTQYCRDYQSLEDIYSVSLNRGEQTVFLTKQGASVGAIEEVRKEVEKLKKKYKLKIIFR